MNRGNGFVVFFCAVYFVVWDSVQLTKEKRCAYAVLHDEDVEKGVTAIPLK